MPSPLASYHNSRLWRMHEHARANRQPFTAIFTDLDETLYHSKRRQETQRLYEISEERQWPVVVVTGNGFDGVIARSQAGQFPPPHAIVGHVGTDIWVLHGNQPDEASYRQDIVFKNLLEGKFSRHDAVKEGMVIRTKLKAEQPQAQFDFQHPEREELFYKKRAPSPEPHKVSFYFQAGSINDMQPIRTLLKQHYPSSRILISEHTHHNQQFPHELPTYCCDVLPMSKGDTVNYLVQLLEVGRGIVAGDSGNDIEMLFETPPSLLAVMVGGSKLEARHALKEATIRQTATPGLQYIAAPPRPEKLCYHEPHPQHIGPDTILESIPLLDRIEKNTL